MLLRRTMLGKLGKITPTSLLEISKICAETFNWTQEETKGEIEHLTGLLRDKHRIEYNAFIGAD